MKITDKENDDIISKHVFLSELANCLMIPSESIKFELKLRRFCAASGSLLHNFNV